MTLLAALTCWRCNGSGKITYPSAIKGFPLTQVCPDCEGNGKRHG